MKPHEKETLRCRLLMEAVLGRLPELCASCEQARSALAGRAFRLRLRTVSGLGTGFNFQDGRCEIEALDTPTPDIELLFLRENQANRCLLGDRATPPIPIHGAYRKGSLDAFRKAAACLQEALDGEPIVTPEERLGLLLAVVLASLQILCEAETPTRRQALSGPQGLLQIGTEHARWWVDLRKGAGTWGAGEPPAAPDCIVEFADTATALAAVQDELDNLAAVGLGQVRIRGNIPLADQAGLLMSHVNDYLRP